MLLVRGDIFVKKNNKLYIVGSTSNDLYKNNLYYMKKIELLAWVINDDTYNVDDLEEYLEQPSISLHLYDYNQIKNRRKIIKKEVLNSECVSLKLTIVDAIISYHYCKKYKKPFIVESGTDMYNSLKYHGGSIVYKLAAIPMQLLIKNYHRRAKYIVYVSRHYLQKMYPSKAYQIGCADAVLYDGNVNTLENRLKKIDSRNGKYILGLVGATHAEYRGHDRLIRVLSKLISLGLDVEVQFVGGGKADDKRKKLAKELNVLDRVKFLGRMKHSDIFNWLDSIDCLVMPTKAETLGRTVVEAMSRGCPVIGTSCTAIPEQIGDDCIVDVNNIDEYVRILKLLIGNKNYEKYCAKENFYRSLKYSSTFTNEIRKEYYMSFFKNENLLDYLED